jgi:hypothetical protein
MCLGTRPKFLHGFSKKNQAFWRHIERINILSYMYVESASVLCNFVNLSRLITFFTALIELSLDWLAHQSINELFNQLLPSVGL